MKWMAIVAFDAMSGFEVRTFDSKEEAANTYLAASEHLVKIFEVDDTEAALFYEKRGEVRLRNPSNLNRATVKGEKNDHLQTM